MILFIDCIMFFISCLLIYLLKIKYINNELNEIEESEEDNEIIDNNVLYYDTCNIYVKKNYFKKNNKMIKIRH